MCSCELACCGKRALVFRDPLLVIGFLNENLPDLITASQRACCARPLVRIVNLMIELVSMSDGSVLDINVEAGVLPKISTQPNRVARPQDGLAKVASVSKPRVVHGSGRSRRVGV